MRIITKIGKILAIILAVALGLLLFVLVWLWVKSPGKLEPLRDAQGQVIEGALAEKVWLDVNGWEQGMFIRSENSANPVLLFLHGGPGSPELPLMLPVEQAERLEKYFTVCYWDQRGAGMSCCSGLDTSTLTLAQQIADTHVVTEYLKERFQQPQIYLMGHSWGSYLGVKVAEKYPEDYAAYIGVGQVTNQTLSEQLAYQYMLQHAWEIGDSKALELLSKVDPEAQDFPTLGYIFGTRNSLMQKYGIGIEHKEDVSMARYVMQVFTFSGYTLGEKAAYGQGSLLSAEHLFQGVLDDNLFESSTQFSIPVHVLHGLYDYQVSYALAKDYIEALAAPSKSFVTFENAAHSPMLEAPVEFTHAVHDIAIQHPVAARGILEE